MDWDSGTHGQHCAGKYYDGRPHYQLAFATEGNSFSWAGARKPAVSVKYVGTGVVETFELDGDAEKRVTKLVAWLATNGFKQSGASSDEQSEPRKWESRRWVRTLVFARDDLPF